MLWVKQVQLFETVGGPYPLAMAHIADTSRSLGPRQKISPSIANLQAACYAETT